MSKKQREVKKIPIVVPALKGVARDRNYGTTHTKLVRRQTNDQLLREFVNARGYVRMRIQPTIQAINGNYYGWHDGSVTVQASTVEAANMFVERLRKSLIDIAGELGLTVKSNTVIS